MNGIKVFENNNFGEVRTLKKENEILFVAKDVCEALDLSNPTVAVGRLDYDEVAKLNLGGKVGETNLVNEYGLYNLVLGSRKPEAKNLKDGLLIKLYLKSEKPASIFQNQIQ